PPERSPDRAPQLAAIRPPVVQARKPPIDLARRKDESAALGQRDHLVHDLLSGDGHELLSPSGAPRHLPISGEELILFIVRAVSGLTRCSRPGTHGPYASRSHPHSVQKREQLQPPVHVVLEL